jgi:hypothetical protein
MLVLQIRIMAQQVLGGHLPIEVYLTLFTLNNGHLEAHIGIRKKR